METESPYDHGKRCHGLGYEIGDNPYPAGSDDAHDWFDGLLDARDAAKAASVRSTEGTPESSGSGAVNHPDAPALQREVA